MILEELVSVLGLEIQADELPNFTRAVGLATTKIAGLVGVTFGAANAVSAFLQAVGETNEAAKFARSIDVGFESLQRLEFAAEQVEVSAGSLRGTLVGLQSSARGAANGLDSGAATAFGRLGIQVRAANGQLKAADQLLLEVADRVRGARNQDLAFKIAEQLGLGPDLNLLLRLGSEGINAMGDEAERLEVILGEDATEASEQFSEQMKRFQEVARTFLVSVGLPVLEWANDMVDRFLEFRKTEEGQRMIERFGTAFSGVLETFKLLAEPFRILLQNIDKLAPLLLTATPFVVAFFAPFIAAAAPIAFLVAKLLALFAVLNDLRVFFEGGDSVIGRGLDRLGKFFGFDQEDVRSGAIAGVKDKAEQVGGLLRGIGSGLRSVTDMTSRDFGLVPAMPAAFGAQVASQLRQEWNVYINGARNPRETGRVIKEMNEDSVREAHRSARSPVER